MKTIYCKLSDIRKHNVIENYPNEQIKKCYNKKTNEVYILHIIYPQDKISIKELTFDESQWFCGNRDKSIKFTSLTCNWFPKGLISGVIESKYNMNHELSKQTGWVRSVNAGSRMEVFLSNKVINAIDILMDKGFEIETNNEYFYHGTSKPSWNNKYNKHSQLYLTNIKGEAKNYAYEMAANDEAFGLIPEPIICIISVNDLKSINGLEFEPDWGGCGVTHNTTWEESLSKYGGFCVQGNINKIKSMFKIENF